MYCNAEVLDPFLKARRLLMLPKRGSETRCIVEALKQCYQGLEKLDLTLTEDYLLEYVHRIKQILFFIGIPDTKDEKVLKERAEELTERIRSDFCSDVDLLTIYFVRGEEIKAQ